MAWAGTRFERGECGIVGDKGALDRIKFVDQDFVEAKIGCVGETIISRKVDRMRVGFFLAIWVGAGALMLDESSLGQEFHGGIEGKHSDTASTVIGAQNVFALGIYDKVTSSIADCGFLVNESE